MRIAIIGCGNMGGAIARGLLADSAFCQQNSICVSNRSAEKLDRLKQDYPLVETTTDNLKAASGADLLILAVKPWLMDEICLQLKSSLQPGVMVLSVAAGIGTEQLENMLCNPSETVALFQAMPNTAIAVGQSMTALVARNASQSQIETVTQLFNRLGSTLVIDEKLMNPSMILGSCGTAFAMRYVRACMEAGIELGLAPSQAQLIVAQTLKGAAELLLQKGAHPETEIDKVTTPGGITIQGLNRMEACGFSNAVIQGHKACMPQATPDTPSLKKS